jgi:hypothetical protein
MSCEIGSLCERFIALVAFVRLLSLFKYVETKNQNRRICQSHSHGHRDTYRMGAHVGFESARTGICLAANSTTINATIGAAVVVVVTTVILIVVVRIRFV